MTDFIAGLSDIAMPRIRLPRPSRVGRPAGMPIAAWIAVGLVVVAIVGTVAAFVAWSPRGRWRLEVDRP